MTYPGSLALSDGLVHLFLSLHVLFLLVRSPNVGAQPHGHVCNTHKARTYALSLTDARIARTDAVCCAPSELPICTSFSALALATITP